MKGRRTLDPGDLDPLYVQLAAILRDMITSGEIPPRRALPSKRELTQEHGISGKTVDKAMEVLKAEGLIVTVTGRGLFVADPRQR